MTTKIKTEPKTIADEYRAGEEYKNNIGKKGIAEQSKVNGRFYVGDHWYGAKFGANKPLVRRNIIRRIADYKLSSIASAPVAVNFSAEGVSLNGIDEQERQATFARVVSGQADFAGSVEPVEVSVAMEFLTKYAQSTIERLKFDALSTEALRRAYIAGTGLIYTYWDDTVETGLYVDTEQTAPIRGDIVCQVLDVENVVFGDPNNESVQNQPYIIVAQRLHYADVRREARRNRVSKENIDKIVPEGKDYRNFNAGTYGEQEPTDSQRVTVYTKFYKEWDEDGNSYKVMCVRCTDAVTVRKPWDIKIGLYPISKIVWDTRRSCAYGDSEITYLVPNQIAINRGLTAQVWANMMHGMPILLQNGDLIQQPITNDPGQIIKVQGDLNDVAGALRFVQPPSFAGQMITSVNDLASNTLSDSGANDAALGNIRPDNAAAIIQMREAALQPMQLKQNQYYAFIEDVMRIWAAFWLHLYGDRQLKVDTEHGVAYVPFHADRYKKMLINARVDVGASTLYSVSVVVSTLDALLSAQIITPLQYLERMPDNIIPDKTGLVKEIKNQQSQAQMEAELSDEAVLQQFAAQNPEMYAKFQQLPPEQQQQLLANMRAGGMQQ